MYGCQGKIKGQAGMLVFVKGEKQVDLWEFCDTRIHYTTVNQIYGSYDWKQTCTWQEKVLTATFTKNI